jgi:hypothetical protein
VEKLARQYSLSLLRTGGNWSIFTAVPPDRPVQAGHQAPSQVGARKEEARQARGLIASVNSFFAVTWEERMARPKRTRKSPRRDQQDIVNPPLDEKHAATYLGVSHGSLRGWRALDKKNGTQNAPVFFTAGKQIRYRVSDLNRWIEARLSQPTAVGQ